MRFTHHKEQKTIMNMSFKNVGLALGIVALSSVTFAQKKNVTSAAVEYKKFKPLIAQQDMEGAKKTILVAKGFIDQAAENPETKEWDKMFWYRGEIYSGLAMVLAQDSTAADISAEDAINIAIKSFEIGTTTGKKYKSYIKDAANEKAGLFTFAGNMAYDQEKFAEAGEAYDLAWQYNNSVGIVDSGLIFNAALCYEKAEKYEKAGELYGKLASMNYRDSGGTHAGVSASRAFRAAKQPEKAKAVVTEARKLNNGDRDLLMELVAISIDAGDNEGAEKALNDAIAADPNNARLHYNIGTIYMNMEDNAKAEESLRKALELDANYVDAKYQLGAHLFNWALQLNDEISFLKINDPREAELTKMMDDKMDGAVAALEAYIEHEPNDKNVLKILWKAYHKKENTEKAKEYKARYDAAQ
jgi:tetratricopeptide (TPR) repeat protein